MRIGILGLGRIGVFHAETLAGLGAVEALVVCDPVAGAARAAAERFGARVVDSPGALLAAGVDGLVVAAATDAHPALIRAGVAAGVPVFCEKPVARTMAEAVQVLKAVAGRDVPVQIGFNRRFDAGFTAARRAVRSGELGPLHTVRSTTLDPAPPPPAYVAASGGIFRNCSVHDFDMIRWVTGREVREVYAVGGNRGAAYIRQAGDADTTGAVLTLDDGTIALVSSSRHNGRGHDVRIGAARVRRGSLAVGLEGTGCRCARPSPGRVSPPGCRTTSSWTVSRPPTGPNSPRSPRSSPGSGPRRARSRRRWRRAGSRRRARCRCASTVRCRWRRCGGPELGPPPGQAPAGAVQEPAGAYRDGQRPVRGAGVHVLLDDGEQVDAEPLGGGQHRFQRGHPARWFAHHPAPDGRPERQPLLAHVGEDGGV
ncbi:Inositol 2-dehydrogenase/D-chiro-inositol 3-dehydrogenase [Streptomyces fumanus]